ncbi:penicillin-binding protein [Atopococcus tabaci]|uniref:penicillin-binding protein n=1 Tax=Atopococcus tabaci TaxID=269774 RepID=UPI00041B8B5B|nr:penicillin-binding protein [Atopococcus tabaci]
MNRKNPLRNRKNFTIILFVVNVVLFLIFAGRFSYIMVKGEVGGENLIHNVNNLYTRSSVLQAERGTIYDSGGAPIAMDASSYKLIAVLTDAWSENAKEPQHVVDKEKTAHVLSQYIAMSEEDILQRLSRDGLAQVEFGTAGNNLSYDTMSKIEAEDLPGIIFEEKQTRLYPNGVFASHLVGLAQPGEDEEREPSSELSGIMGIELAYDDVLKGTDGQLEYKKDRFGYAIPGEDANVKEPQDGKDIYLTLDKSLQVFLETVMSQVQEEHSPTAMTATLMDAETGEILAASQRPTFNATTKENINQTWQNLLVEYTFEPGSTMKVMTLAAAVEEGVFNPNEYYESGSVEVGGGVVHDVKREGWGTISYLEGVARSSNVAFVNLVERMGYDTWKSYLDEFGFSQKTNIGLVNENAGSNPYAWPLQKANTSFGQGITVTVSQMMQAFSAVANDGEMVKPRFIDKIVDPETGEETVFEKEVVGKPISKEAADLALDYLKEPVYSEHGTANKYQIDGYEIAAKTGTAQMVDPETGQYLSGGTNYIYSAVGMAPADDPKLILYVTVQQPKLGNGITHGSSVVPKVLNPVMKWALDYKRMGENESVTEVERIEMPKVTEMSVDEARSALTEKGMDVAVVGTGDTIVQQFPYADVLTFPNEKAVLMTNGAMAMPDLTGWSKNDALKVAELTGIEFVFEGEGYVTAQSIPPGGNMQSEEQITLTLEPSGTKQEEEEEPLPDSTSEADAG